MRKEYLVICVPRRLPRGRFRHEPFSDPKTKHFTWQASITSPTTREIEGYRVDLSGKSSTSHKYANASRSSSKKPRQSAPRSLSRDGLRMAGVHCERLCVSSGISVPLPIAHALCSRWWFCRAKSKCKNSRDITTSRYFGAIHKSAPRG
jgi:hypothetical protein